MPGEWKVDVKGKAGERSWEISVIHHKNERGFSSYGWFGENKEYIGSSGGPCHDVADKFVFQGLVDLAVRYAEHLNTKES